MGNGVRRGGTARGMGHGRDGRTCGGAQWGWAWEGGGRRAGDSVAGQRVPMGQGGGAGWGAQGGGRRGGESQAQVELSFIHIPQHAQARGGTAEGGGGAQPRGEGAQPLWQSGGGIPSPKAPLQPHILHTPPPQKASQQVPARPPPPCTHRAPPPGHPHRPPPRHHSPQQPLPPRGCRAPPQGGLSPGSWGGVRGSLGGGLSCPQPLCNQRWGCPGPPAPRGGEMREAGGRGEKSKPPKATGGRSPWPGGAGGSLGTGQGRTPGGREGPRSPPGSSSPL